MPMIPAAMDACFIHHDFLVDPAQTLRRIDVFLMDRLPHVTRNKIQQAIKQQYIQVNEKPVKASYQVKPQDHIQVVLPTPPRDPTILPEKLPLHILYEDDDLVVVNKAAGMVVHPACENWTGTLVNALLYYFDQLPGLNQSIERPGLVHRIDKDTSGLLVVAKTELAMTALARQFYQHTIQRRYYALVWGTTPEKGTINAHLARHPKDRRVCITVPDGTYGKHAITHYQTLQHFGHVSLIACQLETGRTHQIRAHLKSIGHPLFNDAKYGGDQILHGQRFSKYKSFIHNCFQVMPTQALHAKSLGFIHPTTQKDVYFESPVPIAFNMVLQKWATYTNTPLQVKDLQTCIY